MARLWVPEDLFETVQDKTEQDQATAASDVNATIYDLGFDPRRFEDRISRFYYIEDKASRIMMPWAPLLRKRHAQRRLLRTILQAMQTPGPTRILVLKNRRVGASTAIIELILELLTTLPWKGGIVAHSEDSAQYLLGIARRTFQRIPQDQKPPLWKDNVEEMVWGEPSKANRRRGTHGHEASLFARTAKGNYVFSGTGISLMLLSEAAKYDTVGDLNAQMQFILSAIQAVPKVGPSLVIAETTANGAAGWFYETFMRAVKKEPDGEGMRWIPHFISFLDDEDCKKTPPAGYNWKDWPTTDGDKEKFIAGLPGCTMEHLYFRRTTIENDMNMDFQAFDQEFPATAQLAFLSSGRRAVPVHYMNAQLPFLAEPIAREDLIFPVTANA